MSAANCAELLSVRRLSGEADHAQAARRLVVVLIPGRVFTSSARRMPDEESRPSMVEVHIRRKTRPSGEERSGVPVKGDNRIFVSAEQLAQVKRSARATRREEASRS